MRHSSAVILSALIASSAAGQGQPSCIDYLAGFRSKIEANYAGYLLEVKGERRSAFERNDHGTANPEQWNRAANMNTNLRTEHREV